VRASFRQGPPLETTADTLCVGLFEGDESIPEGLAGGTADALGALIEAGEAKGKLRRVTTAHPRGDGPARLIAVGLGKHEDFGAERARIAAAVAMARAREAGARKAAFLVPAPGDAAIARGLTEGALLGSYRFDRYKSSKDPDADGLEEIEIVADSDLGAVVEEAAVVSQHVNSARDLQNLPANDLTPGALADHAAALAADIDGLEVEVLGRDQIEALKMGGLLAVSKGSPEEPRLIVMRYDGGGPSLGIVGKAVTFDSGGISIKPSAKMQEMKMDMSGGAAAIEGTAAIAQLGLPVNVITVVPATENMPSGNATRPGDIITISNGKTVEVNNTDAEGRLILADGIAYAESQGAERIVDLATLTGAIITALGSTFAGSFSNDDGFAEAVETSAERAGEPVWRMPLHPDFSELTRGRVADLVNASEVRKASSAYAAAFLSEFVDDTPWVHLDIAGMAWDQDGRDYVGKGASGYGVRLLVELARTLSGGGASPESAF
jgi:leucyl aminopeptidase